MPSMQASRASPATSELGAKIQLEPHRQNPALKNLRGIFHEELQFPHASGNGWLGDVLRPD